MSEQQNVKIVQQIYADFGQGNIPGVLSALADDVVWKQPPAGSSPLAGTYHGRGQVGEWFSKMDEVSEAESFEPREYIAQGDKVVALGYYRFLSKSTGKSWESNWAMVWTFREGKVADFQFFGDTAAEAAAFAGA